MQTVQLHDRQVVFRLDRSHRARREGLAIDDQGLRVILPWTTPETRAEVVVRRHARWVLRHLKRWETRRANAGAPLGENEMLLEGQTVLVLANEERWLASFVRIEREKRTLRISLSANDRQDTMSAAHAALLRWIDEGARKRIEERLAIRSTEMNLPFDSFAIRDQRTLWGSCSRQRRSLSFNRRLFLAPPEVLDYIVVHELAHLRYQSHGPRFWAIVERHNPSFPNHRRWLRDNGARLRLPPRITIERKEISHTLTPQEELLNV